MGDTDEGQSADPVLGMDLDGAVERVRGRESAADPESVRPALERVAQDEVVSRTGIGSALGEAAQHVATPENRLELAGGALDAAREAAEPADDLDAVQSRLEAFDARYRDLEEKVDELGSRLDRLVERGRQPENVYDLARSIGDLTWEVRDVHGSIEELRADLESFEAWAKDPGARFRELDGDAEHVADLLDGLAGTIDEINAAAEGSEGDGEGGDLGAAEDDDSAGESDLALAWADAALRRRVIGLLVSDLRAELSGLRTWADREGETPRRSENGDTAGPGEIDARIDDLRSRERALGERLETLARPRWRERFGERIAAFETDLDSFDPPIQWGRVQETLEEHRATVVAE